MDDSYRGRRVPRVVAGVMLVEAASLAVASTMHLSGHVTGRGALFDADHAGIAEAIIGTVLLGGSLAMFRWPHRARAVGLAASGFGTLGFLWGLNITAQAGHWPDISYHLIVLPFLIGSVVALWRSSDRFRPRPAPVAGRS